MGAPYEPYTVFGWKIHRKTLDAGEKYIAKLPKDVIRERIDNISFWVKGRIEGKHTNPAYTDPIRPRVAGFFTPTDAPELVLSGTIEFECVEDSEWWCVNYISNRKKLPRMKSLVLKAGETVPLNIGDKLLVCRGSGAVSEKSIPPLTALDVKNEGQILLAITDLYGLYFL